MVLLMMKLFLWKKKQGKERNLPLISTYRKSSTNVTLKVKVLICPTLSALVVTKWDVMLKITDLRIKASIKESIIHPLLQKEDHVRRQVNLPTYTRT